MIQPAVILYEPQNDLNIGAVLRASANFDVDDVRIVTQRRIDREKVATTATHSIERYDAIRFFDRIEDATADCHHVYATSARRRSANEVLLTPSVAVGLGKQAFARGEKVALLFGREDHGLPNDILDHATALIHIPTSPTYASLNLSQAVLLLLWEFFRAQEGEVPPESSEEGVATRGSVEKMLDRAEDALHAIGFIKYGDGRYVVRSIRNTFGRANLTERELSIWFGVFSELLYVSKKIERLESKCAELEHLNEDPTKK